MSNLEASLQSLHSDGSIKEPSEFARKMLIEYLRQYARDQGISIQQIADRTGLQRSNISRVLAGRYSPTLDTFLKIAGALDLHIDISTR